MFAWNYNVKPLSCIRSYLITVFGINIFVVILDEIIVILFLLRNLPFTITVLSLVNLFCSIIPIRIDIHRFTQRVYRRLE